MLLTIHHNLQRTLETDMAYILRFFNGRHTVEDILLENAVASIGVDGEITHSERGKVLEEMRSLRGVNMIVLQTTFYDDSGC